jgi:hypothetical protein
VKHPVAKYGDFECQRSKGVAKPNRERIGQRDGTRVVFGLPKHMFGNGHSQTGILAFTPFADQPSQPAGVLNAQIHPAPANRRMNMRGVTEQESTAFLHGLSMAE